MASPYRRVILKLSGEALGLDGKLFCHEKFEQVARMLIDIQHTGVGTPSSCPIRTMLPANISISVFLPASRSCRVEGLF